MIDRLFVMWRDPARSRHTVGHLWRHPRGFAFAYERDLPSEFRLLPEFAEHRTVERPFESPYLFATFSQRIPSPSRPDRHEILRRWGVRDEDDPLEILARSGGLQATDQLELGEYRTVDDDLGRPLWFRAAGVKHHRGGDSVAVGDQLELEAEPTNEHDPHAVKLNLGCGLQLGYVPRPYTELVSRLLSQHVPLVASVERQLVLPRQYGRWVVRLERAEQHELPKSFAG